MNLQEQIRKVLNEEIISLKDNPVKYYYYNYLKKEPIEFKGLYLVPKWTGEKIEWKVKNPNNYSYSKSVLTQVFCFLIFQLIPLIFFLYVLSYKPYISGFTTKLFIY